MDILMSSIEKHIDRAYQDSITTLAYSWDEANKLQQLEYEDPDLYEAFLEAAGIDHHVCALVDAINYHYNLNLDEYAPGRDYLYECVDAGLS